MIDLKGDLGYTPLHYACMFGNIEMVKLLLDNGSDKNIQNEFGESYKMINYSKEIGLIPVYSSTKRETIEINKGNKIKKITFFKHEEFVEY